MFGDVNSPIRRGLFSITIGRELMIQALAFVEAVTMEPFAHARRCIAETEPQIELARCQMADGFSCHRCESPSVAFPQQTQDDAHVVCRHCGALIGTLSQYRRNIERQYRSRSEYVSGC